MLDRFIHYCRYWLGLHLLYCLIAPVLGLIAILFYRFSIVSGSIKLAFPNASLISRLSLIISHYHYLGMFLCEFVCTSFVSQDTIKEWIYFDANAEKIIAQHNKENNSIVLESAHYANWEMVLLRFSLLVADAKQYATYRPLHNTFMDRWFYKNRSRFGVSLIPEKSVLPKLRKISQQQGCRYLITIIDHRPKRVGAKHWVQHLGTEYAFTGGAYSLPTIAKAQKTYYLSANRKHRFGRYCISIDALASQPCRTADDKITLLLSYVAKIEQQVKRNPYLKLWTASQRTYRRQYTEPKLLIDDPKNKR